MGLEKSIKVAKARSIAWFTMLIAPQPGNPRSLAPSLPRSLAPYLPRPPSFPQNEDQGTAHELDRSSCLTLIYRRVRVLVRVMVV